MTIIVGVSGKIGAGKNYLAEEAIKVLELRGNKVGFVSFAAPLKNEMNDIIRWHKAWSEKPQAEVSDEEVDEVSALFNIPKDQTRTLLEFIAQEVVDNPNLDSAVDRSPGIRSALQFLGSDIRRVQNENHWVEILDRNLDRTCDYLFATDARFPNEADYIVDSGNVCLRLDVPEEVILARTDTRDGVRYTKEQLNHISETALDDYPRFDFFVGETFDPNWVVNKIDEVAESKLAAGIS